MSSGASVTSSVLSPVSSICRAEITRRRRGVAVGRGTQHQHTIQVGPPPGPGGSEHRRQPVGSVPGLRARIGDLPEGEDPPAGEAVHPHRHVDRVGRDPPRGFCLRLRHRGGGGIAVEAQSAVGEQASGRSGGRAGVRGVVVRVGSGLGFGPDLGRGHRGGRPRSASGAGLRKFRRRSGLGLDRPREAGQQQPAVGRQRHAIIDRLAVAQHGDREGVGRGHAVAGVGRCRPVRRRPRR